MKTLLSEIKKFRSFVKLNEDFNDVRIALIGDSLIYYLKDNELQEIPELVGDDFTIKKLLKELLSVGEFPEVDHVYVSIGLNDRFEDRKNIPFLIDQLEETFPNAEKYVIKAIVDDEYSYDIEDEKERDMIEDEISSYYDIFERNGITVIGDYDSIDTTLGFSNNKINQIKNEIQKSLFQNVVDTKTSFTPTVADEPFSLSDNIDISGDDATDFDTIYEFLERFEEIVDSKNNYDSRVSSSFKADIEQIQIVLNFLNSSYPVELTGKYDTETEEAVYEYQIKNNLTETGLCDHETLEEMLYDLKAKSFDDDDLGKYLKELGLELVGPDLTNGIVKIVGLSGQKSQNVQLMIDYMNDNDITNPFTQIGILCVIGKESGFEPQNEICYDNTSDSRIRDIFGNCRTNDDKIARDWGNDSDGNPYTITTLKKDCEKFFDAMYGKYAKDCLSFDPGHDNDGDGYRYRGRGFNGITFKSNYRDIGNRIGQDLVSDPDALNDVDVAAAAAVVFFTGGKKGSSLPNFTNVDDAINYFVDKNAGGRGTNETRGNAFNQAKYFTIVS